MTAYDPADALLRLARLERNDLDRAHLRGDEMTAELERRRFWTPSDVCLVRVTSIVRRSDRPDQPGRDLVGILGVLSASASPFFAVAVSRAHRLDFSLGSLVRRVAPASLEAIVRGCMPGARFVPRQGDELALDLRRFSMCAAITGAPSAPAPDLVGRVAAGLGGRDAALIVVALPVAADELTLARAALLNEIVEATPFLKASQALVRRSRETVTSERGNPALERYVQCIEEHVKEIQASVDAGLWRVSVVLAADDAATMACLRAAVCSGWVSGETAPAIGEPLRVLTLTPRLARIAQDLHPLAPLRLDGDNGTDVLAGLRSGLVTPMSAGRLAGMLAPPSEEHPGLAIHRRARFKVDPQTFTAPHLLLGEILDVGAPTAISSAVSRDELCKHALVAGVTGSGKSTTCRALLRQLASYVPPVPFLVIEPAKREYRQLAGDRGMEDLLVLTLGEETAAPMRLNPFEVPRGASVQAHIDLLRSAFQAAFPMYPPMPQVLECCLHEIYADYGWDLVRGTRHGAGSRPHEFPTLSDLFAKIAPVVDSMGYDERITQDVKAALRVRIGSLRLGGKGSLLDCWTSTPMETLLERPVVLELEGIADDEEKAFVIGLLLTRLYEHRIAAAKAGDRRSTLRHVTLFEEAHRLLARTQDQSGNPDAANTKAKAVETFANLLSEIRAYGEAIVVAEQIPTKLTPDVVKNTNIKIVHRTVAAEDRELLGTSMKMSPVQREDLAALATGEAIVFCEGFDGPYQVRIAAPSVASSRPEAVASATYQRWRATREDSFGKFPSCRACPAKCLNSDLARVLARRPGARQVLEAFLPALAIDPDAVTQLYSSLRNLVSEAEPSLTSDGARRDDVAACMLVHVGEADLASIKSAPSARGRDPDLLARLADLVATLFADRGMAQLRPASLMAARRLGDRYRAVTTSHDLPFHGCKEACRYRCNLRPLGRVLAEDPDLSSQVTATYADDRPDRFTRVRTVLRNAIRATTRAPESTLDALATCTFVHLTATAGLSDDDERWTASRYAQS